MFRAGARSWVARERSGLSGAPPAQLGAGSATTWTACTERPGHSRGRREDAEDLVQETYALVLAKPRWLRRDDDLGYLLRVLRNTYVSGVRARGRRPAEVPFDDHAEPVDHRAEWDPAAAIEAGEQFPGLDRRLGIPLRTAVHRLGVIVERHLGRPPAPRAHTADIGVAQHPQEVAEIVVAAQPPRLRQHERVGLLHQVLGILAPAAQRPGRSVQPVHVVAEPARLEPVERRRRVPIAHALTLYGRSGHRR